MKNKRKFPFEIIAALCINTLLIILVFICMPDKPKSPPALSVKVDISNYALPKPKTIPRLKHADQTSDKMEKSKAADAVSKDSTEQLTKNTLAEFSTTEITVNKGQSISKKRSAINDILNEMNFFNGVNGVTVTGKAGGGGLPAGHRIGESFQSRLNTYGRGQLLRRYGGDKKSEDAVAKALKYLSSVQNADGSWGSKESFRTGDAAALSSLALLTFLAHGENSNSPKYGPTICKATDFLLKLSNTADIEYAGKGFGHAIVTYALAEAYALGGSMSIERVLQQRLKAIIQRQNKFGSFNINYDNSPQAAPADKDTENSVEHEMMVGEPACDLSLLGWHIQALTAATNAGMKVAGMAESLQLATEALIKIHQAKDGGFSQGINMKRFKANEHLNSVGLLSLQLLGLSRSALARRTEKMLLQRTLPQWTRGRSKFPLYRWYYQTQALFQVEKGRGRHWKQWNDHLKKELTASQHPNGSWSCPKGDHSFLLKNQDDLSIYASSLCALMLQVYYRYLPSYSIAEASDLKSSHADGLDLGMRGLITQLPGGSDSMSSIILGLGPVDMKPIYFGKFNGHPISTGESHIPAEFSTFASLSSTIAVRKPKEWPQTLQPNQRIALFFDDLLPEGFKGHLQMTAALVTDAMAVSSSNSSLEVTINGKRVYNSILPHRQTLARILIPASSLQAFGNVLQIRNNGKSVIAFDGVKIAAITKVGKRLYLATEDIEQLPPNAQNLFNIGVILINKNSSFKQILEKYNKSCVAGRKTLFRIGDLPLDSFQKLIDKYASRVKWWELTAQNKELLAAQISALKTNNNPATQIILSNAKIKDYNSSFLLPSDAESRQVLPVLAASGKSYDPDGGGYWGCWPCIATERMGNAFQLDYLRRAGKDIVDWLASGGNAVILKSVYNGGKFYDSIFRTELPALAAIRQVAKLFEGNARQLPACIYPKYGENPLYEANAVAALNAPGVATIVIAKHFPLPDETEISALIPWNGPSKMIIEKGFMPKTSPYSNFASTVDVQSEEINISNNEFKYSGILPEMTVIRLIRKGFENFRENTALTAYSLPKVQFDYNAVNTYSPKIFKKMKSLKPCRIRTAGGFAATLGVNCNVQNIPATIAEEFTPCEKQSLEIDFKIDKVEKRYDSVYLSLGNGPENARFLSFAVLARVPSSKERCSVKRVEMPFVFSGRCFKTYLPVNRWQYVTIALNDKLPPPYWSFIRIIQPEKTFLDKVNSISYEINEVAVLTDRGKK